MEWFITTKEVEHEEIKKLTDNFSEKRLITKLQFGTLYRGRYGDQELTVKVFDKSRNNGARKLLEEFDLFYNGDFKGHPKVISYCNDKNHPRVMVFDLNPLDSLHNLILKDNFSWSDRVKVALGFAEVLRSLHDRGNPFKIRNIDAGHILCDQEYTPILCDNGITTGGIFGQMGTFGGVPLGSDGYTHPYYIEKGICSEKGDVFAYGVVLLGLISKRVVNAEDKDSDFVDKWAEKEFSQQMKQGKGQRRPSLVDESLRSHPYYYPMDGRRITWLAMKCIKHEPDDRPDMEKVVKFLKSLTVIRNHGNEIGVEKMLERL